MSQKKFCTFQPKAEFLDVIGTKVLRVFLLDIHSHLSNGFYSLLEKNGLKLVFNVNIVYEFYKCENSQDCAQKPPRNCTVMDSASGLDRQGVKIVVPYSLITVGNQDTVVTGTKLYE